MTVSHHGQYFVAFTTCQQNGKHVPFFWSGSVHASFVLFFNSAKTKFSHHLLYYLHPCFCDISKCLTLKISTLFIFHGMDTIGFPWSALFEFPLLSTEGDLNTSCLTVKLFLSEIISKRPCSQSFYLTLLLILEIKWCEAALRASAECEDAKALYFSNIENNFHVNRVIIKCRQSTVLYFCMKTLWNLCTGLNLMFQPAQRLLINL